MEFISAKKGTNMGQAPLPPKIVKEMLAMYDRGVPVEEIPKRLGIGSSQSLYRYLIKNGRLERRVDAYSDWPKAKIKSWLQNSFVSVTEVALRLGKSHATVLDFCKRAGIEIPKYRWLRYQVTCPKCRHLFKAQVPAELADTETISKRRILVENRKK